MSSLIKFIPLSLFIIIIIFLSYGLAPRKDNLHLTNKPLPDFKLPSFTKSRELSNNEFKQPITLLNFWASWCASCAEEHLFLMQLAKEGIPVYGINYKDNYKEAKKWLQELGNPYQLIGIDKHGKLAIDLGVYGTPETFLIDQQGMIRAHYRGALTAKAWQKLKAQL